MWKDPELLLQKFLKKKSEYKCYAEHEGEKTGKKHYHCYIRFRQSYPTAAIKKTFGENVRAMNGDDYANAAYISRDGTLDTFVEHGIKKKLQEQNVAVHVDQLLKDGKSIREIILEHIEYRSYIQSHRWVLQEVERAYQEQDCRDNYDNLEQLRDWQQHILDIIGSPPHPRHIHWFVDSKGSAGKTAMTDELCMKHDAVEWKPIGTDKDCSHQLLTATHKVPPNLIVCDLEGGEYKSICWPALERAKNGKCYSSKYEGGSYFGKRPHVLIFSNENPMSCPLTEDRLVISTIVDNQIGSTEIR